jgi:hypothetical protein
VRALSTSRRRNGNELSQPRGESIKRLAVLALSLGLLAALAPTAVSAQEDYETTMRDVEWSETPVVFLISGADDVMGLGNEDYCRWMAYVLDVEVTDEELLACAEGVGAVESAVLPETMLPAVMETVLPAATPAPTAKPTPKAAPKPKTKAAPKPKPKPKPYKRQSKRGWQQIVKSPDRHLFKQVEIWGCITQFDAATGDDTFRADASYKNWKGDWWFNGDNAIFTGSKKQLRRFLEDDIVWMRVSVFGSFSYDTQIGGSTTVPLFFVDQIKRVGSC